MNKTCFTFPPSDPGQAAWAADPSCRGTFGIALLCLSTTTICIWSSVHRDIPLERLPPIRSFIRDAPLVLVALFAPELMFFFALNQYLCARNLVKESEKYLKVELEPKAEHGGCTCRFARVLRAFFEALHALLKNENSPSQGSRDVELGESANQNDISEENSSLNDVEVEDQPLQADIPNLASHPSSQPQPSQETTTQLRQHTFTLKHGFYAAMGGFTIKGADGVPMKLTAAGVGKLMKENPELIPDLPTQSILDREKSTNLGKALLIVQVLWFCLNCISRLAQRLPLSLLEVTTLAHGLFTLLSYAMWWSKPLNIDEPTWITTSPEYSYDTSPSSVPKFSDLFSDKGLDTLGGTPPKKLIDFTLTSGISFIYGILHFLAFRAQYPTTIERHLWRVACVVVMSSGLLFIIFLEHFPFLRRKNRRF